MNKKVLIFPPLSILNTRGDARGVYVKTGRIKRGIYK